MKWLALVLAAGCAAACAGRTGEILTDPGDLAEASGYPDIQSVVELGGGDVLLTSDLKVGAEPGDGLATVGEALWVKGSNFGRQPTVTIAGRPAAVLARTVDGGLVVRVPATAPAGPQRLTVVTEHGHDDWSLIVRRLVATLLPESGRLAVVELAPDGPRAIGDVPATGQMLRVGPDGRAAYVLDAATGRLTVFELPAQHGPRAVLTIDLGAPPVKDRILGFSAAAQASSLMVLRTGELTLLDASPALRPIRSQPRPLPAGIVKSGVAAGALSPDGRMAALAVEEGNRVVLLDVSRLGAAQVVGEVALAPEARVPVLVDVAFAPDGKTLWVVLGDTAKSGPVGPQPTEIAAVRIERPTGGLPAMRIARRVRLDEAESPVRLNTGGAIPLPSGASIRLPPERATVYLTAAGKAGTATIFRLGPEDKATPFIEVLGSAGGADLSPDGRWLLVPVIQANGRMAVVSAPADDRPGERRTVDLGTAPGAASGRGGAALPWIAAQP